jgi:hypothetical protein
VENLFKATVPSARQIQDQHAKGICSYRVAADKESPFDKANTEYA